MTKVRDLTGMKFGRLVVVDRTDNSKAGKARWNCICECGTRSVATGGNLMSGSTTTCGCGQREGASSAGKARLDDLIGKVFGRLIVESRADDVGGKPAWNCKCSCGNSPVVTSANLRTGSTTSCGCYRFEMKSAKLTTHGLSRTAEYKRQKQMRKYARDKLIPVRLARYRVRSLISKSLSFRGMKKTMKSRDILGCDFDFFRQHIESQFVDGMSWERMSEIHIDHRIPLALAETVEDVIRLCHYTNLQPLWALDNLKKGSKMNYDPYLRSTISPDMARQGRPQ